MDVKCIDCSELTGFVHSYPPIFHFGNSESPIALFSINPSESEFKSTSSLPAPFEKWTVTHRKDATPHHIESHLLRQDEYFTTGHHLEGWFGKVEEFLNKIGTHQWGQLSFGLEGRPSNVVHLDIVKCATKDNWSAVPDDEKPKYIANCSRYLISQVARPSLKVLLINGSSVHDALIETFAKHFTFEERHSEMFKTSNGRRCTLYRYVLRGRSGDHQLLLTGTSMRISREKGQFSNPEDREYAATRIQNWINDFV